MVKLDTWYQKVWFGFLVVSLRMFVCPCFFSRRFCVAIYLFGPPYPSFPPFSCSNFRYWLGLGYRFRNPIWRAKLLRTGMRFVLISHPSFISCCGPPAPFLCLKKAPKTFVIFRHSSAMEDFPQLYRSFFPCVYSVVFAEPGALLSCSCLIFGLSWRPVSREHFSVILIRLLRFGTTELEADSVSYSIAFRSGSLRTFCRREKCCSFRGCDNSHPTLNFQSLQCKGRCYKPVFTVRCKIFRASAAFKTEPARLLGVVH